MSLRWDPYVPFRVDVEQLLSTATARGRTAYVLGIGFDPRALVGLRATLECRGTGALDVVVLGLPEASHEPDVAALAEANQQQLSLLADATPRLGLWHVPLPDVQEPRSAGLALARQLIKDHGLFGYDTVVVDVSSLPASLFFPVIGAVLEAARGGAYAGNFQVVACENPKVDAGIHSQGAADPGPIHGFIHGLTTETTSPGPVVWAPVIGEQEGAQLDAVHRYLDPDEICPVLPFPARNPRRADDLILEHRKLLFDVMQVEPRNFIFADESNPFDLYRALCQLHERYAEALRPLGEASLVVSVHASKLLSIGALLAAWERKLPVVAAQSSGYLVDHPASLATLTDDDELACLWLEGEPYR